MSSCVPILGMIILLLYLLLKRSQSTTVSLKLIDYLDHSMYPTMNKFNYSIKIINSMIRWSVTPAHIYIIIEHKLIFYLFNFEASSSDL